MSSRIVRLQAPFTRLIATAGLLLAAASAGTAQAADVGVSISIGQPGFYGNIDIGNYPRPQVIYAEPVIIQRPRVVPAPVYIRVPPGHEKHWDKHCGEYNACGRPVYFVQDRWYQDTYVPAYRERHYRDDDRRDHDYHDRDDDDDQGHGNGHGNGKGHGNGNGHGHGHGND